MKPLRRFTVPATVPPQLAPLERLARNLRWTWHPPTQDLFAEDQGFTSHMEALAGDLDRYLTEPRWYQQLTDAPAQIAYFSPEFGVSEVLPQYSGGLGVLAGDHL